LVGDWVYQPPQKQKLKTKKGFKGAPPESLAGKSLVNYKYRIGIGDIRNFQVFPD